jgi:hypothetical protein
VALDRSGALAIEADDLVFDTVGERLTRHGGDVSAAARG